MNDIYEAGLKDDKFALLHNANSIIQGDVFAPVLCSKQVDTFGKECLEKNIFTYTYRGEVEIPPLSMMDDVLTISECGTKTSMVHGFMKMKTDSKKLQFGAPKCKKMHVGKNLESFKWQTLKVDDWKEIEIVNEETGDEEIQDIIEGTKDMENKENEKYLGDILSTDGRNIKNVKARVSKGTGIISRILAMLEGIPFGPFYYQVGVIETVC